MGLFMFRRHQEEGDLGLVAAQGKGENRAIGDALTFPGKERATGEGWEIDDASKVDRIFPPPSAGLGEERPSFTPFIRGPNRRNFTIGPFLGKAGRDKKKLFTGESRADGQAGCD